MSEHGSPVVVENPKGAGPFVIVCDHASNRIPDDYRSFGYAEDALTTHIAWDPGALGVSRRLSAVLDAPLLWPDVSRLVIDCDRPIDASSLIVNFGAHRRHQSAPFAPATQVYYTVERHAGREACRRS